MKKQLVNVCKLLAAMCALTMTLHCACVMIGIEPIIPDIILGVSVWYFLYVVSKFLNFCRLYRTALLYGITIYLLWSSNWYTLFSDQVVSIVRWLMFLSGVAITLSFVVHVIREHITCKRNRKNTNQTI